MTGQKPEVVMRSRRLTARATADSLQKRLTELEARAGISAQAAEPMALLFVDGNGKFRADKARELGSGRIWPRKQDEHIDDFVDRVMAEIPPDPSGRIPLVLF